jgi:ubiquinone/menaquinone biosynthesis C-methylase UbiE
LESPHLIMLLSPRDWHHRYMQQAGWTRAMRSYLFRRFDLGAGKRVLEVGCGTGAVTSDISITTTSMVYGLDLNFAYLSIARTAETRVRYTSGDAFSLPFPNAVFDAVCCHFFLLWIRDIPSILAEMRRVTRHGGVILALAEPDYGGRIDFPDSLSELGQWQAFALGSQGAQPNIGRRLMAEFNAAGFDQVDCGLMGGQWKAAFDPSAFEAEWKIIEADLAVMISPARLQALRRMDEVASRKGERILYVPTFYACGKIPPSETSSPG